jgi:hypothetical protein
MDIQSIAQERLNGPEWAALVAALEAVETARDALLDGVADQDAGAIDTALQAELSRRGLLAEP